MSESTPLRRRPPVVRLLLPVLLAALLAATLPCQRKQAPRENAAATMHAVAQLLERGHLLREPIDDVVSARAFDALLAAFDPSGLYLLQSDVDALGRERLQLDDEMLAGDDGFVFRLQHVLEARVPAAVELGLHCLQQPQDFSVDETMRVEVGPKEYSRSQQELADRWRRRIKYDLLVLDGDGVRGDDAVARLRTRYERMVERTLLREPEDLDHAFLEAIASAYDPHTSYLPPRAAADLTIQLRLQYEGIGAVLEDEDGRAIVGEVLRGGAAAASGELHPGDVIQGVGEGKDGGIRPVQGLDIDDVVDRIRGPSDSTVRLQVTTGSEPPRVVELQRRKTELQDSRASGAVTEQDGARIGWIDLPGFYGGPDGGPEGGHSASGDVAAILRDFGAQRVDTVVLDLRNNGGGLLTEATALTGLFLDTGNVVQVQGASGEVLRYDDDDPGALWTGPLVVLINRFSASASEIVAGAIADQGRGLVVGDTSTHGKGTVQTVIDLAQASRRRGVAGALKLTVQQFFRPGGDSTQLHGVRSDVVLPSLTEAIAEGEAALPNALPFAHIAKATAVDSARRDRAMIARLQQASQRRCDADPEFQRVVAGTRQRQQWTTQKVVPLQQQAFAIYRGVLQQLRVAAGKDRLPWYTAEVRRIAADYAGELRGKRAI